MLRVLRLKPGAEVRLFDGCGRHGMFQISSVNRGSAMLRQISEFFEAPQVTRCTMAAGFSKALRRGWFMEKTVELGAFAVWFWRGDYSQSALPDAEKGKWKEALVSGAKQCETAYLPTLALLPGGVNDIVDRLGEFDRAFMLYEGDTGGRLMQKDDLAFCGNLLLVVGPEGGFSPAEVAALAGAGVTPVSLGNRILRWETAAVLTLGMAFWARQGL